MTARASLLAASLVSLSLMPLSGRAAPPESRPEESPESRPEESSEPSEPVEGSASPPDEAPEPGELPPPGIVDPPLGIPPGDPDSNIEFAVPPPEAEQTAEPAPAPAPMTVSFPDPGMAPNDGNSMLVLGGTTVGLTIAGASAAIAIGLRRGTSLELLLPSTIVPTVGLLAFGGYGLGLGIQRAIAYRRWEAGYRVIGLPQGGGLTIAGGFALLGAVGFGSVGVFALRDGYTELGASLLGVGIASGVAMPIFFAVGARRARTYQRTGGWRRRPVPGLPPGAEAGGEGVGLSPVWAPVRGGGTFGVAGRF